MAASGVVYQRESSFLKKLSDRHWGKVLSALRFKHSSLELSRVSDTNLHFFKKIETLRKPLDWGV